MNISHDVIRNRVDGLRAAMHAKAIEREQAVGALTGDASQSRPGSVDRSMPYPESHLRGALHMCPWHTCQGTKISPDAS